MSDEFEGAFDEFDDVALSQLLDGQPIRQAVRGGAKSASTSNGVNQHLLVATATGNGTHYNAPASRQQGIMRPVTVPPEKRRKIEEDSARRALRHQSSEAATAAANAANAAANTTAATASSTAAQPLVRTRQNGTDRLRDWGQSGASAPRHAAVAPVHQRQSTVPPQPQPSPATVPNVTRQTSDGLQQRQLDGLKRRLDNLQTRYEEARRLTDTQKEEINSKSGEAAILRQQMQRLQQELDQERQSARERESQLQAHIEAQDNSYKKELEAMRVETVFKKHEIETSRTRMQSVYKARTGSVSPSKKDASPSATRQKPMTGFNNAFAPQQHQPQAGPSNARESSAMPPPVSKTTRKMAVTPDKDPKDPKGKGKEVESADAMQVDHEQHRVVEPTPALLDLRSTIVEQVLNHLTPSGPLEYATDAHRWISTIFHLTTVRLDNAVADTVRMEYDTACKQLFDTISNHTRHSSATSATGEVEGFKTGCEIAASLEALVKALSSAAALDNKGFGTVAVIKPLVAALTLITHLVSKFEAFAMYYLNAVPQAQASSRLLPTLASILRRFCRPTPPTPSAEELQLLSRSARTSAQRRRAARASLASATAARERASDIVLKLEDRVSLLDGVLTCLRALAFESRDGVEAAFSEFLACQDAVAVLLDPLQPRRILTSSLSFVCQLATRPRLFRALTGTKFYPASDFTDQQLPLIKRVGFLLFEDLKRRLTRADFEGSHALRMTILSLTAILAVQHEDALTFITNGFIMTEFINLLASDVRSVWGPVPAFISDIDIDHLCLVVDRLSSTVQLLHYLLLNARSTIEINEMLQNRMSQGAYERYSVSVGTILLGGTPRWAVSRPQAATLTRLSHLASDLLEEQTIEEEETMMACFGVEADASETMKDGGGIADDEEGEEVLRETGVDMVMDA